MTVSLPLLSQPFHDEGPVCVPHQPQSLGDSVTVRVWVPDSFRLESACVRQTCDGEPRVRPCVKREADGSGHWYEAEVLAHNPVTRYRFAFVGGPESPLPYSWLTAGGLYDHDVSDSRDFSLVVHDGAPDWVNDAAVYQIFPDRFARSSAAVPVTELDEVPEWATPMPWNAPCSESGHENGGQLYGGDLGGVEERLDYIAGLGFNTIYLTPIFPGGSAHHYDASTFDQIDPLLGGDEALASLTEAVHARGMRLILDLTTNHTGVTHEWFTRAVSDPDSKERGYYMFRDYPEDYVAWLDVPTLPKLDHEAPAMRAALYEGDASVTAKWLAEPFNADGWRIDVANMTGRYGAQDLTIDVARTMRKTMGPEHWLIAEHGHDATRDLDGDGWHGTMNYVGFTRPIWSWLSKPGSKINWLGLPMGVPTLPTASVATTLREYNAEMPWPARIHSQNQLCSHDTARIRTVVGDPHRHMAALGALIGLPGVPTLFAGDEFGLEGLNGEHARTPMPWADIDGGTLPDEQMQWRELTSEAFAARASEPALRRGGLRFVHIGDESLTWLRTDPVRPVLVHVARAAHNPITLDVQSLLAQPLQSGPAFTAGQLSADAVGRDAQSIELSATSAGAIVLPLTPLRAA